MINTYKQLNEKDKETVIDFYYRYENVEMKNIGKFRGSICKPCQRSTGTKNTPNNQCA